MQAVVRFRILQEEPSIILVSLEPIARRFVKPKLEGISIYIFLFSFFLLSEILSFNLFSPALKLGNGLPLPSGTWDLLWLYPTGFPMESFVSDESSSFIISLAITISPLFKTLTQSTSAYINRTRAAKFQPIILNFHRIILLNVKNTSNLTSVCNRISLIISHVLINVISNS